MDRVQQPLQPRNKADVVGLASCYFGAVVQVRRDKVRHPRLHEGPVEKLEIRLKC